MSSRRIFFAGLFHESHSFLNESTKLSNFEKAGYASGKSIEVLGSPMKAAITEAREANVTILEGPYFFAMPSGIVCTSVMETWKARFREAWDLYRDACDGIFLVLHGAMVADSDTDVESTLVSWIRSQPEASELPIHVVLDLHGNISKSFSSQVNCAVAYRKNPHTDAGDAARQSIRLLVKSLQQGQVLRCYWKGTSIVWPPSGTGTTDEPMKTLESCARAMECQPGIHVVNVFAGYSYADTYDTGVSFSLVADKSLKPQQAIAALEELNHLANKKRTEGIPVADTAEQLLDAISRNQHGPILVAEPSDNIGGGAPGDCTGLLRLFLEHNFDNAGIVINDPEAVLGLQDKQPGDRFSLSIGGKGSTLDTGAIEADVELIKLFDGSFDLEDPQSHLASMCGTGANMGACALVQLKGITLLLTSIKTPPFDLGQWRVAGINPEDFQVIGVKAAVAYRQAYDPIASAHLTLDTPGPCPIKLSTIPFRHIRRPVFPLDDI